MTTRVVLFIAFILLGGTIIYTKGYKSHFSDKSSVSLNAFNQHQKEKAEAIARAEALKNKSKEVVAEATGPDLSDPIVKKGMDIYTGSGQCITCHGANGEGNVDQQAPLIAGQHEWYVSDQLAQMKSGARSNEKMNQYIANLSGDDFKALAKYIQALRAK